MAMHSRIGGLLRNLFRQEARDKDLERELDAHIVLLTEEKIARGLPREQARRAALLEMEGKQQVKEAVRDVRSGAWLEQFWQDVRFGGRMLRKNPGFTTIAVLTLALGIGANTAMFSLVHAVLLRPLPYWQPEQLVLFRQAYPQRGLPFMRLSQANYLAYREQAQSFAGLAAFTGSEYNLTGAGEPARVEAALVSSEFFDLLGAHAVLGRTFRPGEDAAGRRQLAILSYGYWQREFGGDRNVIGRVLRLNSVPTEIIGVMPAGFAFPSSAQLWLPLDLSRERTSPYNLLAIGRLKPGVSAEQVQAETTQLLRSHAAQNPAFIALNAAPAADADMRTVATPLQQAITGRARTPLLVLLGAVGLVLLIACANVANLLLTRATRRTQEIAVRVSLGATAGRLFRQLMAECLVLGLLGCAAGVGIAVLAARLLSRLPYGAVPRAGGTEIDVLVLGFAFVSGLTATLLFGVAPAARGRRLAVTVAAQSARMSGSKRASRTNGALVALQFALSLVLLVGTGLLLRSFQRLVEVDPGFGTENLLTMQMYLHPEREAGYRNPFAGAAPEEAPRVVRFYEEVAARVRALPGVSGAAVVSEAPLTGGGDRDGIVAEGHEPQAGEGGAVHALKVVGPGYFQTMGIRLLRGRDFSEQDRQGSPAVAIVDETFARRYWPDGDAVGRRIRMSWNTEPDAWMTIAGVVSAVRDGGLAASAEPSVYRPHAQRPSQGMGLVVRTSGEPAAATQAVRAAVQAVNPAVPIYDVRTLDEIISDTLFQHKLTGGLLATFAGLAVLLAAIGIYGVISLEVTSRLKELAIRAALGAKPGDVFGLVLQRGALLTGIGAVLGVAAAAVLTRLLGDLLFGVTPLDGITFASAVLTLAMVAFLACAVPARRAAAVDPMVALRQD